MSDTTAFLNSQIESSHESWKRDHVEAMECLDLQNTVAVGVALFNLFRSTDDLWSRDVQSGKKAFDASVVENFHRAYTWWLQPCDTIMDQIHAFEKRGHKVEGAENLRNACREVKQILTTDIKAVIRNFEKARAA